MMLRTLTLAGGLTGAAGLSQFPEYSQQYTQRLGGAVDELTRVVQEFDQDAAAVNATREEALIQLAEGGEIGAKRAETMTGTIKRQEKLSADLEALEQAGPFTRAYNGWRFTDSEIAQNAWKAFKPAVPLTFEGVIFAAVGFFASLGILSGLIWLIRLPFRSRVRT